MLSTLHLICQRWKILTRKTNNRGATIILNRYDVELSQEEILELTGVDADELEFMTIEDIANDYIDEDILNGLYQ